jgi:hypothetical protein
MFPTQLPVLRLDGFSRCGERVQQRDQGNVSSLSARTDASLKGSVEHAIWNDEVLREIGYYEIDTQAKNGIVYLDGHIANTSAGSNKTQKKR